ncbi:unnamed protein product, partial [Ilex paraguariensis]
KPPITVIQRKNYRFTGSKDKKGKNKQLLSAAQSQNLSREKEIALFSSLFGTFKPSCNR